MPSKWFITDGEDAVFLDLGNFETRELCQHWIDQLFSPETRGGVMPEQLDYNWYIVRSHNVITGEAIIAYEGDDLNDAAMASLLCGDEPIEPSIV